MIYLVAASSALTIGLLVMAIASFVPARPRGLKSRIAELELDGLFTADSIAHRSRSRSRLQDLLEYFGQKVEAQRNDWGHLRRRLIHAGYREPAHLPAFLGIRFGATAMMSVYGFFIGQVADFPASIAMFTAIFFTVVGWFMPGFVLSMQITKRQRELQKALPDALDLLVICVEAGLGLNQALVRVAQEMRHASQAMTEEITLANMAIRAGTPRDQALMDLSDRTGVPDVRSLATMLIQTERFGTSIAKSLRIHADSMRMKRKQRAEEAAAKTTIKMIFPLAFCIFPALFVVVLGPALLSMAETLSQM